MTAQELRELFRPLHEEAVRLARATFDGAPLPQPSHPCRYLVRDAYYGAKGDQIPPQWRTSWMRYWHLPEPFSGEVVDSTPLLAFVGLNPSIDWREPCPTIDKSLDEWLTWWRGALDECGRFHAAYEPVPLYEEYQRILRWALGPTVRLGREAVVLDAIHYKAIKPVGSNKRRRTAKLRAALIHGTSSPLTVQLLKMLAVKVVVTVGNEATRFVGAAFVPALAKSSIRKVHGSSFMGTDGVVIIPARHRNDRSYPWKMREPLAKAIADALKGSSMKAAQP